MKKGHITRVCKSKTLPKGQPHLQQKDGTTSRPTHIVKEEEEDYSMYKVTATSVKPLLVSVSIDNASLEMEVDTGASVSIISEELTIVCGHQKMLPFSRSPLSS